MIDFRGAGGVPLPRRETTSTELCVVGTYGACVISTRSHTYG